MVVPLGLWLGALRSGRVLPGFSRCSMVLYARLFPVQHGAAIAGQSDGEARIPEIAAERSRERNSDDVVVAEPMVVMAVVTAVVGMVLKGAVVVMVELTAVVAGVVAVANTALYIIDKLKKNFFEVRK